MKKVLVFGSFDLMHPGHINFLKSAKKHGDHLTVVLARDSTIKKVKGKKPRFNEKERLKHIKDIGLVEKVLLGSKKDKLSVIKKLKPDIICLGYDQKFLVKELKEFIEKKKLSIKIKRLKAYKPHIYKSSKLKKFI